MWLSSTSSKYSKYSKYKIKLEISFKAIKYTINSKNINFIKRKLNAWNNLKYKIKIIVLWVGSIHIAKKNIIWNISFRIEKVMLIIIEIMRKKKRLLYIKN